MTSDRHQGTYEAPAFERIPLEPATFAGYYKITWPLPGSGVSPGHTTIDHR